MRIYRVGGAVRDRLLNLPVKESDWVVVGTTPQEMISRGFRPLDREFPVFAHPQTGEEYALARTERKIGPGHKGFAIHAGPEVTLEEDLRRRDLTINAMAEAEDGTLMDPFHGQDDLNHGILRHVSPAFVEDPLRLLRVARFAACFARWGFRITHGTYTLMKRMVEGGELATLAPERVWRETERALRADTPARYFETLQRCNALSALLPELHQTIGACPADHTAQRGISPALQKLTEAVRISSDPTVRYAALLQGLAASPPGGSGENGVAAVCDRLRVPAAYRELAMLAASHHFPFVRAGTGDPQAILETLESLDAFRRPERFARLLQVWEAVAACQPEFQASVSRLQGGYAAASRIDTRDLYSQILPGEKRGEEIRKLRRKAIAATL
jgi:tRNA nucleotidyltransferase (CCA-adding enzyme)